MTTLLKSLKMKGYSQESIDKFYEKKKDLQK